MNAQIEGDEASFTTAATVVRLGNRTQIFRKTVITSGTADAVRKYGMDEQFAYELAKRGKELKRDIEYSLSRNSMSTAGSSSATARLSAGIESMIVNYVHPGTPGTAETTPGFASGNWAAPTDGTAATDVTLSEASLRAALQLAWEDGGDPSTILCGAYQKRKMAEFVGASAFDGFGMKVGSEQGAIIGAVDLYVSDFGKHKVMLHRYMRTNRVLCLDREYLSIATLRPIRYTELAKTGDARKGMLLGELCLVADNPDAHAKVVGLKTS